MKVTQKIQIVIDSSILKEMGFHILGGFGNLKETTTEIRIIDNSRTYDYDKGIVPRFKVYVEISGLIMKENVGTSIDCPLGFSKHYNIEDYEKAVNDIEFFQGLITERQVAEMLGY